ncbi:endonuclease NucS domain-containing protein [Hathewaya massiliensis]|uniref:endonuclease NucS domain-containing protein n=1 Tax=Hathewaya massiliensis TaxID=1964382 RepID=UPI00115A5675|nr:endonuclease NucS domain-containing protein [Hathewaya massiliensis]
MNKKKFKGKESLITLESYLREFIVENLDTINIGGKALKIYECEDGTTGIGLNTDVGVIDVLATDEEEHFVVFHLRMNKANEATLGQTLKYMGWVKNKLASDKKVLGIIVSREFDKNLKYAVTQVENVNLFQYKVEFNMEPADIE